MRAGLLESLSQTPEWYLVNAALAILCFLGLLWKPMFVFTPLLLVSAIAPIAGVVRNVARITFPSKPGRFSLFKLRVLTGMLHLLQPLARLWGRRHRGFSLWSQWGNKALVFPSPCHTTVWSEAWQPVENWLGTLESLVARRGAVCVKGGDFDRWDLQVHGGVFGAFRVRMAIEEHGGGKQLVRFRAWPRWNWWAMLSSAGLLGLTVMAGFAENLASCGVLAAMTAALTLCSARDLMLAKTRVVSALSNLPGNSLPAGERDGH